MSGLRGDRQIRKLRPLFGALFSCMGARSLFRTRLKQVRVSNSGLFVGGIGPRYITHSGRILRLRHSCVSMRVLLRNARAVN